jgi:preprotein translocase subunit SecD
LRLVYTVDVQEAIRDKRDRYYDDMRSRLAKDLGLAEGDAPTIDELAELKDHVTFSKPRDIVDTVIIVFHDAATAKKHINQAFLTTYLRELRVVPDTDGKTFIFQIRNDVEVSTREKAVGQAKETILRRIDGMGVKEASVSSRDEDIIVEIPGQDDKAFQEIRDIISQTARLEFKMLDDEVDFLKPIAEGQEQNLPKGLSFSIENAPIGSKGSKANYYARLEKISTETMQEALMRMKAWAETLSLDEDHELGFGKIYGEDETSGAWKTVGWRSYYLKSKAELTGDMVRDAQAVAQQSDSGLGGWQVDMQLGPRGAELFEKITGENIKRRFAIILDGQVESAPVIEGKIPGGNARITMGAGGVEQQLQDAKKLELVLRSGALPAPISPTNEQRIGASLGADSIDQGVKAAGFAGIFVVVLILIYYRRAGVIATIAVMFNLVLQISVLSMFSASMTLPGIAGLALTVGVAVDANVLINERIREELRDGKSTRAAVTAGYDKAFSAIIDGHATTLISGLILAQYGTGPIKGFAVTLIIGMVTSLFTGVVVTRLFFEFWVSGRRDMKLSIGGRR